MFWRNEYLLSIERRQITSACQTPFSLQSPVYLKVLHCWHTVVDLGSILKRVVKSDRDRSNTVRPFGITPPGVRIIERSDNRFCIPWLWLYRATLVPHPSSRDNGHNDRESATKACALQDKFPPASHEVAYDSARRALVRNGSHAWPVEDAITGQGRFLFLIRNAQPSGPTVIGGGVSSGHALDMPDDQQLMRTLPQDFVCGGAERAFPLGGAKSVTPRRAMSRLRRGSGTAYRALCHRLTLPAHHRLGSEAVRQAYEPATGKRRV